MKADHLVSLPILLFTIDDLKLDAMIYRTTGLVGRSVG